MEPPKEIKTNRSSSWRGLEMCYHGGDEGDSAFCCLGEMRSGKDPLEVSSGGDGLCG